MRGKRTPKRKIAPDEIYGDIRIAKFINYVMRKGKKDKAKNIVYKALEKAAGTLKIEPVEAFNKAVSSVRPEIEVRSRRVGGANYQIPVPVPKIRGEFLAMNWIIDAARSRKGKAMLEKLSEEIVNAYNQEGDAIKKKENIRKMAESNRAFAHFRW